MSEPSHARYAPIDKLMWQASKAFIRQYGPISMHLGSFNTAITELIPGIVEHKGFSLPYDDKIHRVTFSNVHFQRPTHREVNEDVIKVNPKLCIDRRLSYTASVYIDITYEGPDGQTNMYKKKYIGELPVMVRSELCTLYPFLDDEEKLARLHEDVLDVGGYFIIKGVPKVLVPQVRPAHNLVHTYPGKNTTDGKPKFSVYAETRSGSSSSHTTTAQVGVVSKTGLISVVVPYIDMAAIPLGIMFRALGVESEEVMASHIFPPEWFTAPPSPAHKKMILILVKSLEQSWQCDSQEVALNYIGRRGKKFTNKSKKTEEDEEDASEASVSYAKYLLSSEFLPHVGLGEGSFNAKCIFLGYMTQKLLLTIAGLRPMGDRDHFALKRIHTSGMLIANQFYNAFRQLVNKITAAMTKDIQHKIPVNIASYITAPYVITSSLHAALSSNKWGSRGQTQGISQTLDNFNRAAMIAFLRKFIIPMNQDGGKIETPRLVQGSQWRVSCLYATPEGKKVGLVQGFAMGSYISVGCDDEPVIQLLRDMDMITIDEISADPKSSPTDFLRNTRVFVNGTPQGYTRFPNEIVDQLRDFRRNGCLNPEISISYDKEDHDIRISTDAGRSCSAVAIAPKGKLRLTEKILKEIERGEWDSEEKSAWMRLMEGGFVEIISKDEEEEMNVAIFPSDLEKMPPSVRAQYTHCELTPDLIEGAGVSTSPHNHRNQAPRNIYQEAMSHQSIGVFPNSHFCRRGKWHVLDYPQKPIVSTRISRELGFNTMGMGQNATCLIMPWYGMNQEDSIVMSEAAIKRGFMNSTTYIGYEGTVKMIKAPNVERYEAFEIPTPETCNDFKGYAGKLAIDDEYVYVPKGTTVQKDDILIGMTVSGPPDNSIYSKDKTNISIRYDQKWPGVVHSVQHGFDGEGYRYVRVVIAQKRTPIEGDKFSARHGQKGTIGAILPPEEMPFLKNGGYTPDILVNPLAFPSRMTIGMLVEAIMGVALTGSALKCPEFNAPLCLDKSERKGCTTSTDWMSKVHYEKGFDPHKDYDDVIDGDGTPWDYSFSLQRFFDAIKKMGINEFSEEVVINPKTGKELKCLIFSSVVYYQRLKHMVLDKIHSRARGTIHALHRQPAEGRKKGGGFRIGHMERDCQCFGTPVALREGIAVPIEQLTSNERLWSWDAGKMGLLGSGQSNYAAKGVLPRYDITLQDGRKVGATRNHPFLTENGEWSDLKDLKIGERLVCSANYALVDFEKDMEEMGDWEFPGVKWAKLCRDSKDLSAYEKYRRSMCLGRIMGLVTTDGHIPETGAIRAFLGHLLDVESFLNDVERITGERPEHDMTKNTYQVYLPNKLGDTIRKMGVISGAKVDQHFIFPDFVTNENTPKPILREFLGGLFGGDGHTVCLSQRREKPFMKSVAISWTRTPEHLESLIEGMKILKSLLEEFGVCDCTIQNPKLTTNSKHSEGVRKNHEVVLNIPIEQLINFSEKIGFRYCVHKSQRLDAGVSYRRFREGVLRQRQEICELVDIATDYRKKKMENPNCVIGTKKAILDAKAALEKKEPLLHKESVPTGRMLGRILTDRNNNEIRSETFPTVGEYFEEIGVMKLFEGDENTSYAVPRDKMVLPYYHLRIIDIRANGTDEMFDITVDKTESFVANGIVSHNCMLGQGLPAMTADRLFHQSDEYRLPVCTICGLQAIDVEGRLECRVCNTSECVMVPIPFGTKLMNQEFSIMNAVPRIITHV